MKIIRKTLFILVMLVGLFTLTSCFDSPKEFSGSGMTIELNSSFVQKEVLQVPFYLESMQHIFMGQRESKADLLNVQVLMLTQYIYAVLANGNKKADVEEYNEDGVKFYYAYYTSEVDGRNYGYMLLVMEGENHFYSMNFGCLESNLEKNKTKYINWAKTITVE